MATITIRPLADRVLVKRLDEAEEQKVGGIIIPDTAKEKPQEAEIVAVGPGRYRRRRARRLGSERRRQGPHRQVLGHRGQDRGRRISDYARRRHPRHCSLREV